MTAFSFDTNIDDEYRAKVLNRLNSWRETADFVIQKFDESAAPKNDSGILRLNESLLFIAAKAFFDDIYKYKVYSGSERVEPYKSAGYTLKWLSKIRPIQINSAPGHTIPKAAIQINGFYALSCALSYLDIELNDVARNKKLIEDLLYNSLYRNISGKSYAITFKLLEELVKTQAAAAKS
jgi:hypothetical protein